MIRGVLDQEEEYDGDDGEHDQGLGDDVVKLILLVMLLKKIRVSEKFVIGTAHTKVTFKICKLRKLININKGSLQNIRIFPNLVKGIICIILKDPFFAKTY